MQFHREEFLVPIRPRHGTVHHQPEGLDLSWRPLVTKYYWDLREPEFARRLETEVAIHDLTVAPHQARDLEAEFADRGTHAVYGGVVLAGVPNVRNEPVDGPELGGLRGGMRQHACPSKKRPSRILTLAIGAGSLRLDSKHRRTLSVIRTKPLGMMPN